MTVRSLLLRAIALGIGMLVALILAEFVVRISGISSPLTYVPNSLYGWAHTPNDSFSQITEDYSVDIKTNSLGLRDTEHQYNRSPGSHRTLVLGDSFTEALQVPLQATYPKLLEHQLNTRRTNSERTFEVINAGTSGYGTDNELLFYRHEGFKYNPDVVLLAMYVGNDIRNNWYVLENQDTGGFRKPYYTIEENTLEINAFPFVQHDSFATRIKLFLNRNVRLYSLIRATRDRLRVRNASESGTDTRNAIQLDNLLFQESYSTDWITAWQITKALILELQAEVRNNNATLLVAIIPTQFQVHNEYWTQSVQQSPSTMDIIWDLDKPNKILTTFLTNNGISFLDLLPEFRSHSAHSETEFY